MRKYFIIILALLVLVWPIVGKASACELSQAGAEQQIAAAAVKAFGHAPDIQYFKGKDARALIAFIDSHSDGDSVRAANEVEVFTVKDSDVVFIIFIKNSCAIGFVQVTKADLHMIYISALGQPI